MGSRLPTFLHPLAGRPLLWHALSALATADPPPSRLLLVSDHEVNPEPFLDVAPSLERFGAGEADPWSHLAAEGIEDTVLLADARAPLLATALPGLLAGVAGRVLVDERGRPAAARLGVNDAERCLTDWRGMDELPSRVGMERVEDPTSAVVVRSRVSLARASGLLRDRLVRRMMEEGVTFLLPETVWIDTDVRIGRDCVIYPSVVIEGATTIGDETVIGPGCRILDSWVGSGVELKGWNYLSHTSLRNRAIMEPYARRGFD